MSRSGYSGDFDNDYPYEFYRQAVHNAINGRKGQALLCELAQAMDAMPVKEIIVNELVTREGAVCTMGVICKVRGLDVADIDPTNPREVAKLLKIAPSMAQEIAYENDEVMEGIETDAERWTRMRKWVGDQIKARGVEV